MPSLLKGRRKETHHRTQERSNDQSCHGKDEFNRYLSLYTTIIYPENSHDVLHKSWKLVLLTCLINYAHRSIIISFQRVDRYFSSCLLSLNLHGERALSRLVSKEKRYQMELAQVSKRFPRRCLCIEKEEEWNQKSINIASRSHIKTRD